MRDFQANAWTNKGACDDLAFLVTKLPVLVGTLTASATGG
jgi:hypothetical protein